jgi:hypothetical protein
MPSLLLIAGAACLVLALASLALPSGATYDPYAWLIWGRDLAHLKLATGGTGTSWKPLPAAVAALLSPLGRSAAQGWLVVARAGALFAVFMAFRLAWRLAPREGRVVAGVIAAASVIVTQEWLQDNGIGYAEGLMVAFGLLAVERHLDGHRVQAFALIVAAGMVRVEVWPFAIVYGVWLWRTTGDRRARVAVALGALITPLLWFGGDWLGSGSLTTAANRALQRRIPGSPGVNPHPAAAVLRELFMMVPLPVWIAVAAAIVIPHAQRRVTLALAACAAAWTAIVAVMAERGYAGLPRFLFMATGLWAVVAGVGAGCLVAALMGIASRTEPLARRGVATAGAGVAAAFVICMLFAFGSAPAARKLAPQSRVIAHVARMDAGIARLVRAAGGADAIVDCGRPRTPWYTRTAVAWELGVAPTYVRAIGQPAPALPAHGPAPPQTGGGRQRALLRRAPACQHGPA